MGRHRGDRCVWALHGWHDRAHGVSHDRALARRGLVDEAAASANFGTATRLEVSATNRSGDAYTYLRFDLSSIPAGAVVRGVTLEAHAYEGYAWGGDGNAYTHFVADDTWGEGTINWTNQPTVDDTRYG